MSFTDKHHVYLPEGVTADKLDDKTLQFFVNHNEKVRQQAIEALLHDVWDRLGDGAENDKIILELFKKYGVKQ